VSRVVDPGAVFAGWVGLGMSVIAAISLALVFPVQPLVFLFAPIGGLLIGWYANARAERRRPLSRVVLNAVYAGLVTAVALVLLYGAIRLLFVYADTGYPDFNRTDRDGLVIEPTCQVGPACTYARYVRAGQGPELGTLGVTDAASFERYALREQLNGSIALVVLTMGGALAGGAFYAAAGTGARRPAPSPVE
jgi:hypothetical protein